MPSGMQHHVVAKSLQRARLEEVAHDHCPIVGERRRHRFDAEVARDPQPGSPAWQRLRAAWEAEGPSEAETCAEIDAMIDRMIANEKANREAGEE